MATQTTLLILTGWIFILAVTFPSIVGSDCPTGFKLIDFEGIATSQTLIPSGYYNLDWTNVMVVHNSTHPGSGYVTALRSGEYVALNSHGNSMSISAGSLNSLGKFTIKSFVAAAAWNNNLNLFITGQRGGITVYNKTLTLQTTRATTVVLDWHSIDNIAFITSGGIAVNVSSGSGEQFAMDNLCINTGSLVQRELLYKCDYWGDPQLVQFPKKAYESVTSAWCQISGSSILYQSSYALINVVNSGPTNGDIITAFDMTLYDLDKRPLCTLTQHDMTETPRSCGPDVIISKTGFDLNIAYRKASFSVWIKYSSWGGGHYKFTLFTTLQHINANTTNGMCVKGCTTNRNSPQLLVTDSTTDKEIVTSAMAHSVCDRFIKEATKKPIENNMLVETTPGYIEAVRRACVIDVTVTGSIQFAEQCATNIITDRLTHDGQIKIEEMMILIKNTTVIAQQTINEAERQVEIIVEGATWPCKPDSPICIMPSFLRRKFISNKKLI